MKTIREMLDERAQLITQARGLVDVCDRENRAMSAEEEQQYNKLLADSENLKKSADSRARLEQAEASLNAASNQTPLPAPAGGNGGRTSRRESEEYRKAYLGFLRNGFQDPMLEVRDGLLTDSGVAGGYLLAPLQMVRGVIKAIDDLLFMRQLATVLTLDSAESLGAPSLDADPADPDWTSEIGTVSVDSTMAFGRRELKPNLLTKMLKISYRMLNRLPNVESFITNSLGYKFGVAMEKGYMVGTGAQQPLGVFTASNDGISTARDVSTGNGTTYITFDGLQEAKYSVKAGYRRNANWLFHRDAVKQLAKIKNGEGQYMWQPAMTQGAPDMLLASPTRESEYAPNTFTTGLYVGLYGDFSYYWIADSLGLSIQRLVELYSATNQIGLKGMLETDGMPVLAEAFARVKLA